jgi:uncharacterized protein (TIGR00251 family)
VSLPVWLREEARGVVLSLHIQPGATRTEIVGLHGEALKIRLHAPPIEGRANAALIEYLARMLAVPRGRLSLVSGEAARAKRVCVEGLQATEIAARLVNHAGA